MTTNSEKKHNKLSIGIWEKYLSLWVGLSMIAGILIGYFLPGVPIALEGMTFYNVSIPTSILLWIMIFPMFLKIDFFSVVGALKKPKGIALTSFINYAIKPFTMFAIAAFFFYVVFNQWVSSELAGEYIAGAVLLGAAPCTAMVFVWSKLTNGDPAYTLVQVSVNDILILLLYVPIVSLLLGVTDIDVPMETLVLSLVLFIVAPLVVAIFTRNVVVNKKGKEYFENTFIGKFDGYTNLGLVLTLIIIFTTQGQPIIENPIHILLIAVPLIIQNILIYVIGYGGSKACRLPYNIAAPAAMVGTSNFFELAVAVSISMFGLDSGATLVTVVGVLIEVPMMLLLVKFSNKTKHWFDGYEY